MIHHTIQVHGVFVCVMPLIRVSVRVCVFGSLGCTQCTMDELSPRALSGGGSGNFGVLTAITLKPEPIPPSIVWYDVIWPITLLDAFLPAWMAWAKALPPAGTLPLSLASSASRSYYCQLVWQ